MINHQGPLIPARVSRKGGLRHRVLAGPFEKQARGQGRVKRLKIDLESEGAGVLKPNPEMANAPFG